ncbi:MAG: hypothetical protein H8F28_27900, partial [Fibrella sp.]|nr:hypothetical protein [Armatimonadota bacterium]
MIAFSRNGVAGEKIATERDVPPMGVGGTTRNAGVDQAMRTLRSFFVPVLLLTLWQVASMRGILPPRILPAPLAVLAAAQKLVVSGDLWRHLSVSAGRAFLGLAVGGGI